MPSTVPTEKAATLTQDRVIDILNRNLSTEMDSLYSRTGNVTDDGIFLPDPDEYYRQPAPTGQQLAEAERVAVFTGQTGAVQYGDRRNVQASGFIRRATIPWAIVFVFGESAPGSDVSDPVTSNALNDREVQNRRADYYEGALRHTITKYGMLGPDADTRDNAILAVDLQGTFSRVLDFPIGEAQTAIRGTGLVEFTVDQWQLFPADTQT